MTKAPDNGPAGRAGGSATARPRSRRFWRFAFGLAMSLQLVVLYFPQGPAGPQITGLDKVIHVVIFAGPALAALSAGLSARWTLGILAVHAPVSELIQQVGLPGRTGDLVDLAADVGGVALGALAYVVVSRRWP